MEINVVASFPGAVEGFAASKAIFMVQPWSDRSGFSIELVDSKGETSIEQAIVCFVSALRSAVADVPAGGELRAAVYYTPDEVAAFLVSLSIDVIELLAKTGLALEVIGFPYSAAASREVGI